MKIEPIEGNDKGIEVSFDFQRPVEFDLYYKEFKYRQEKKNSTQSNKNNELSSIKFIRNPIP